MSFPLQLHAIARLVSKLYNTFPYISQAVCSLLRSSARCSRADTPYTCHFVGLVRNWHYPSQLKPRSRLNPPVSLQYGFREQRGKNHSMNDRRRPFPWKSGPSAVKLPACGIRSCILVCIRRNSPISCSDDNEMVRSSRNDSANGRSVIDGRK